MKDLLDDGKSAEDDSYDLLDEPSGGKNLFFISFAVIILLALGFIFYQFVLQGDGSREKSPTPQANVPILLPESVLKEIPEDAGGLEIRNQDQQVFEVIENPTQPETVVPEEEEAPAEEVAEETPPADTEAEAPAEATEEEPADVADTNLLPLPEEPQLEAETAEETTTPEVPEVVEPTPAPAETGDKLRIEFLESTTAEEPEPIAGGLDIQIPDEPLPEPEPEPAPEPEATEAETEETTTEETPPAPPVISGGYIVQLAALDNLQSAELSRNSFIEQFPDLLLADRLVVQEGLLSDGRAIFRVQMTLEALEEARSLCGAIKEQGRDCFIKRAP